MTGQIKNLIHSGDLMAMSQVEPLRGLGLDYLTFTDGTSETKISGEFTVLTKKEKTTGLTYAVRPGDYLRHRAGWWDVWNTVPEKARYTLRTQDGPQPGSAATIKPLNFALTELTATDGFTNFKMVNYTSHHHIEVGTRRMFGTGGDTPSSLLFIDEQDSPQQNTQADLALPRAELYPWATPDLVGNNGWTVPWVQAQVQLRTAGDKTPVSAIVTVGGRIFRSPSNVEATQADTVLIHNPDNVGVTTSTAFLTTETATPFSTFATAYSAVAPSKVRGKLCYGIASFLPNDYGHLQSVTRSPLWAARGTAKAIQYNGRDYIGNFTSSAEPSYTYGVLNNRLEARLMAPVAGRVSATALCMVVHSAPMAKPPANAEDHKQHSREVMEAFYDLQGVEPYFADLTAEIWHPKPAAPSPENHSFIFWSGDNGRSWSQQGDTLWHEPITGKTETWHSKAALSMAAHMARHTVLIQDSEATCLMVVALPHCVDEGFDFSKVKPDDPPPSFAHSRPKQAYTSRDNGDVYWAPQLAHDKLGFYDPVNPHPGGYVWFTALDDAYFNTRLWRWAVFRVSAGGVHYLTSLSADYPPCDYAVSRTSGVTESHVFIHLKPVYHREQPSVLLVSQDRGLSWHQRRLPATRGCPNGSGIGLVFPFRKDELVMTARDVETAGGVRRSAVYLMRSQDMGQSWRRWETVFSRTESTLYHYPHFIYTDMLYGSPYIFGRGYGLTLSDGWYGCDFTPLTDENGEPFDLNPCRPWLNDDRKKAPLL